jgi:excisionase family DNA binding protein
MSDALRSMRSPLPGVIDIQASAGFDLLGELESQTGLLTVEEVAAIFRISKFTVYRMVKRKQIPCLLIGGSRRFDPKTLGYWARKKDPMLAAAAREVA